MGRGPKLSDLNTTARGRPSSSDAHIIVVAQWRQGYTRLPIPYADAVRSAGGHPKVFSTFKFLPGDEVPDDLDAEIGLDPHDPSPLDGASGLVIPGGGDIDPQWYGCERHPRTHNVNHRRDLFELTLLAGALERDMPVLAICHGMQLLNVYLGGTLDQHLADGANRLDHDRDMPRSDPAHGLRVKKPSLLAEALGRSDAQVNSHHHQGLGRIADGLEEVAWAEDGVLEAVQLRARSWVVGVQWHPELMAPIDKVQQRLFKSFVDAAHANESVELSAAHEHTA
jgi:putative glutamine amidotransferase